VVNPGILTILLVMGTDDLELRFRPLALPLEFLKIVAVTSLSLIACWLYSLYLRKKGVGTLSAKIKGAVVLTALISSYLYVIYTQRIVANTIIDGPFREQLAGKIKTWTMLANGTQAAGLTIREYQTVAVLAGLPSIPSSAGNIEYQYAFDGFLPDYTIRLVYDVPPATPIATFEKREGRNAVTQSVSLVGAAKRVEYTEDRN